MALKIGSERQDDLFSQVFVNEVMSLPVMHDALALASSLYCTTKEKQYIGVALQVAEVGVLAAARKALPLASPLVERVGRWAALNEWACKGLDRVKQAMPFITQPTKEVVSVTCNMVLTALAGDISSVPPPTVGAALASRATRTMGYVAESRGGRVALRMADSLLDTAHIYLDTYLPSTKGDLNDSDGRHWPLVVKMVALTNKTRHRLKRNIHTRLNVNSNQDLDDDDIIITSGHLLELGRRSLLSWYRDMSQQQYIRQVMGSVYKLSTLVMDRANTMHTAVVHGVTSVHTLAANGVGLVFMMVTSGRAGLVLVGGFHMASDVVGDAVCLMNKAVARGVDLAHIMVMNGMNLFQMVRKGGLDVACTVAVKGVKITQCRMTELADMAFTVLAGGVGIAHKVVMKCKGMTHSIFSRSMSTTEQRVSFIQPTITSFALFEYAHRAATARLKTQHERATIQAALRYVWVIPGGMLAWVASVIHLHSSADHKVHEE